VFGSWSRVGCWALRVVVALGTCLSPADARADWLLSIYAGAAATSSNTVEITPASESTASLGDLEYEGRSFASPIYYGYRIGWTPGAGHLGIEAEFTHAKAIATRVPDSDLTAFQLSHGLNFVLGNVSYRTSPGCGGRCALIARGGAGVTVPHVEATFRGRDTSSYQFAGFGAQVGAGVELKLMPHVHAIADARLTYARVHADLAGAKLSALFTSGHLDFGIAWRAAD
jgi:hypothetical protein